MKHKKIIKMTVDILMTVILLFLMAYQVTGDKYHEWIGVGMLILFLVHNGLNLSWYTSFFKGKYSALRVFRVLINIGVLAAIILTGYSGIVMSRHVFAFLPIDGGMATARRLHLSCSYWSFLLMSVHLGMHWSMVISKLRKKSAALWILRAAALGIAVYGAILFHDNEIFANMFLKNEFAMLDYESPAYWIILENILMMSTWVYIGHYLAGAIVKLSIKGAAKQQFRMEAVIYVILSAAVFLCTVVSSPQLAEQEVHPAETVETEFTQEVTQSEVSQTETTETENHEAVSPTEIVPSEEFVFIQGGTFEMGSPDSENWRSSDENLHSVTVGDFYISAYELTQAEYTAVIGENPSSFSGDNLPVESITWLEAVYYCNARSEQENLTPVYLIDGSTVSWNRGADGYRLPTEAEWEYACRAGTTTPFNTETSISPNESNYYGHYPYEIEGNYFEQENLTTQPGIYRQTTVEVDSFEPNSWGLYNMHGNVSEWVWDYYGAYDTEAQLNPTGPDLGNLRVYRGGGWNDFAKNMRSAYRATLEEDLGSFNIGIRLVRNAVESEDDFVGGNTAASGETASGSDGKVLIAYFSWGGNTRGAAEEIQAQTGADLFEITLVEPYSSNYNTVLDQSQQDQNVQARPELAEHVDNMDEYDTILLGYPNWWASIPMPVASFLEEYDFSGKTIIPFCSHGGGRFGQSLTAIAKLAPNSVMGEGLSIHYSGGGTLASDISEWLRNNGVLE